MIRKPVDRSRRVTPSLLISVLALFIALSGTAYALGKGEVKSKHLAGNAVTTAKIKDGAVNGAKVSNGSLRLKDLGGQSTNQTTVVPSAISIPANECRSINLGLFNPAPNGVVGSVVVGTVESSTGDPVLNNNGYAVPTLVTETSQGGAIPQFRVCAAGSAQSVPANSVVTWSLLGP